MKSVNKYLFIILFGVFVFMLSSCSAEVGSERWCKNIKEKTTADLTANEVADFAKHCVLK